MQRGEGGRPSNLPLSTLEGKREGKGGGVSINLLPSSSIVAAPARREGEGGAKWERECVCVCGGGPNYLLLRQRGGEKVVGADSHPRPDAEKKSLPFSLFRKSDVTCFRRLLP